ncbi:toprim domain-containing protein [Mycoplasmatota bacterium WC44]
MDVFKKYLTKISDFTFTNGEVKHKNFTCPICGEDYKQASYKDGYVRCYGSCSKSYGLIGLAQAINDSSKEEAVKSISVICNLEVSESKIVEGFIGKCHKTLDTNGPLTKAVLDYLFSRLITIETIKEELIGILDLDTYSSFNVLELEILGIKGFVKNHEDKFIIFPIRDNGQLKSFILRKFSNEGEVGDYVKPKGTASYMMDGSTDEVCLCEGVMDYYSLKNEYSSVWCLLGVALPKVIKERLKEVKTVITAFDNDKAGDKLQKHLLRSFSGDVFKIQLPEAKDINDMHIELGNDKFKKYIEENKVEVPNKSSYVITKETNKKIRGFNGRLLNEIESYYDDVYGLYVKYTLNDEIKFLPINSSEFKEFIVYKYQQVEKENLTENNLKKIMVNITPHLRMDSIKVKLANRVAMIDNVIYYDLSRNDKKYVVINKGGWKIVDDFKPLFINKAHQLEQVLPVIDESNSALKELLYLFPNLSDEQKILLLSTITTAFIPSIARPILSITGGRGSGKSFMGELCKKIIDPSKLENLSQSRSEKGMIQDLENNYYVYYDNLDSVPKWFINRLCVACTGGGESRRKLFSDNEIVIFKYKRSVSLSSINKVGIGYTDLLERMISISLKSITPEERRTLKQINNKVDGLLPRVLGNIFSLLSKALCKVDSLVLEGQLLRLADYSKYSVAILTEYGYTKEDFFNAYKVSKSELDMDHLEYNPVVNIIYEYLLKNDDFIGTATELLEKFKDISTDLGIDTKHQSFPRSAASLSRRIKQYESSLNEYGIDVEIGIDIENKYRRYIKLTMKGISED